MLHKVDTMAQRLSQLTDDTVLFMIATAEDIVSVFYAFLGFQMWVFYCASEMRALSNTL